MNLFPTLLEPMTKFHQKGNNLQKGCIRFEQKIHILLIIIILLGAILRFSGTIPGYNPYHSDEPMSYSSAWQMVLNGNFDPKRYDYPSLVSLINNIFYRSLFIPIYWVKYFILNPDILFSFNYTNLFPAKVIGPDDIKPMYWSRIITALFSTILIYLSYLLSCKISNSKLAGILTAVILAVNYRVVMNSHFGLPDIYNAFFFCLSLLFIFNLFDKPNLKNYLLAGLVIALSFNIKFQIFALLPFIITHFYISIKTAKNKRLIYLIKILVGSKFLISLLIIPVLSILLNPYHLFNLSKFYDVNYYTYLKYTGARSSFYGISYLYYIALTPIIFITVLSGVLISVIKSSLKSIIILSLPTVFLYNLLWGIGGATYTRNFISIIPILLIFSGQSFFLLYQLFIKIFNNKILSTILFLPILGLALFPNLINSLVLVSEYTTPWEMRKMNSYIFQYFNQKVVPNKITNTFIIASHPWDFSVVLSKPENITSRFIRTDLEPQLIYSLQELKQEKADYALIGLDMVGASTGWWMGRMNSLGFNFWLEKNKILRNQFVPLAVNELTQNTVFAGVKRWQAPDNNYVFVKIPKPTSNIVKQIKQYSFDQEDESSGWQYTITGLNRSVEYDKIEGHLSKGAIIFTPVKNPFDIYRTESPFFEVEGEKKYRVEGWIKSSINLEKNQREGFLRIDYYSKIPDHYDEKTIGDTVNISARYFGQNWIKLEAEGISPSQARFATIGFQVSSHTAPKFWLDDINISEVTTINDTEGQKTTKYIIPNEVMFPYSQGGL